MTVGTGRPIPRPSYNFFEASSRGESGGGISVDDAVRGVLGEELDLEETDELSSPSVPSPVTMATEESGSEAAAVKRRGEGRVRRGLTAGGGETRSEGGGVILTKGADAIRFWRTELD